MVGELTISVLHLTAVVFAIVQSIIQMWQWVIKIKLKKITVFDFSLRFSQVFLAHGNVFCLLIVFFL